MSSGSYSLLVRSKWKLGSEPLTDETVASADPELADDVQRCGRRQVGDLLRALDDLTESVLTWAGGGERCALACGGLDEVDKCSVRRKTGSGSSERPKVNEWLELDMTIFLWNIVAATDAARGH